MTDGHQDAGRSEGDTDCQFNEMALTPEPRQPNYIPQIREWMNACEEHHGSNCATKSISQRLPENVPSWLIDTVQQCIVPGLSANRYLALSYVWPETRDASVAAPRTLLLDADSVEDLQTPRFLLSESVAKRVPAVIHHAMELTAALGERYLWCDRLCILQHDPGTLSEVAKMDQVYAGAYLTIIAASPDHMYEAGLGHDWPSFKSSSSRDLDQWQQNETVFLNVSEEDIIRIINYRYQTLAGSRWGTRGWTYQEQILCTRAIMFTQEGIFWDCPYSLWDGVNLLPNLDFGNVPLRTDMGMRFSTRWWPDFGFYVDLICPYNGRQFSYPQDALLGVSGILNALLKSFPGGFLSGLPRLFLDHALIWQPFGVPDRRLDRKDDQNSSDVPAEFSSLPSWAWCGWQCFVDPWSLRSGLAYIDQNQSQRRVRSWRTRNLVDWYISGQEGESHPIPEPRIFDHNVNENMSQDPSIPDGWTAHYITGQRKPRFSHDSEEYVYFKHPIPLVATSVVQSALSTISHLIFRTSTTSFYPAAVLKIERDSSGSSFGPSKISAFEDRIFALGPGPGKSCPILVLAQPNHAFGGLLRLMSKDAIDPEQPLELIAISKGSATARDLRASHEWKVFERGQLFYEWGSSFRTVEYEPQWLTQTSKYALLFDIPLAFDARVVNDEAIGHEFDDVIAYVNERAQLSDNSWASDESKWFTARIQALSEMAKRDSDPFKKVEDSLCEFYNVLWIQRKDGIACRRACGWVPKHVWEAHATAFIDVTLG